MNGPEHYREAEKLLGYAEARDAEQRGDEQDMSFLAEAQAHATLALAAATAMGAAVEDDIAGLTVEEREAWFKVAGVKPGKDGRS